jgi:glycosyltransferase involved in cell wall biosynthesis
MLLSAGTLIPHKGPQWIINALPHVLREVPQVTAVLCGTDLGYKKHLEILTHRLKLENNVIFAGYLPREELLKAYSASDVFVLPSDFEGFGLAIAEAMASGKPVVASHVGAVPFVVEDGRSGFLVPPQDPTALADRIIRLLRDDHLRESFGERGLILSQEYRWEKVGRLYEHVYRCAMRNFEQKEQDTG